MAVSCCVAGDNAGRTRFVASAAAARDMDLRADIVAPGDAVLAIPAAVLHGPGVRAQLPPPRLWSGDAGGNRASKFQHAVEDMDRDVHLGRPTFVGA